MPSLLEDIRSDISFIKGHTLQPRWYKVLKVFLVAGFLIGYDAVFGLFRAAVFLATFIFLCLLVHMAYRAGTERWQKSWLDFTVEVEQNEVKAKSIGKIYYSAIIINAILAVVISQVIA